MIIFAFDQNKVRISGLMGMWPYHSLLTAQSWTPGHLRLVLGLFGRTTLPFLHILIHVCGACRAHDIVSRHVGWLSQGHGVLSKALGLKRNPWFFSQPPSINTYGGPVGARLWGRPGGSQPGLAGPVPGYLGFGDSSQANRKWLHCLLMYKYK